MCGICGRYNFNKGNKVNIEEIKKMSERLRHRGPDQNGFFTEGHIGLGHQRLKIIDIHNGQQPMYSIDENYVIVYNGEIYNYLELRQELSIKGYQFKSYSDTEVLINLYIEYKERCLDKLNGMFAFAIYDRYHNTLFCARDRLGIKPFYYYKDKEKFLFASEIKSLLASQDLESAVNSNAIKDYLAFQFILDDKTFYNNVRKLLPGHFLVVKNNDIYIKKYWDIDYTIDVYHTEDYFVDKLLMLLEDAVRLRLRSDVSLGAHLSGGLDSSTITSLASNLLNSSIKTFTGAFDGIDFDETKYAKIVSKKEGTEYFEVRPTSQDFINTFEDMLYYMDEPCAGPGIFPQFAVSKLASQHVKVVLGGQGGDEVFGGYIRYLIAYFEQCIKGAIYETNEQGEFVVDIHSIIESLPYLTNYQPLMQKFWSEGLFDSMGNRYFHLIQRMDDMSDVIDKEICHSNYNIRDKFLEIFESSNTKSYFNKMTYFDLKTFLPALLHVEDRASMAYSLESRVPLLDYRIIELLAKIPPTIKFKGGKPKYLFRKVIRNIIPPEIMDRKDKKGFPVPISQWYKTDLNDYVKSLLFDGELVQRGIVNKVQIRNLIDTEMKYGRKIWGLLNLEVFYRNLKRMR